MNLLLGFFLPGIAWQAHLGGLLVGAAAAGLLAYAPKEGRAAVQWTGLVALVLIVAALGLFGLTGS